MSSSLNNLWYCHECHTESIPLRVPTAECANCHSNFIEEIEGAGEDLREFGSRRGTGLELNQQQQGGNELNNDNDGLPPNIMAALTRGQGIEVGNGIGGARIYRAPGITVVTQNMNNLNNNNNNGYNGTNNNNRNGGPINPIEALMQVFGMIPPAGRVPPVNGEVGDPDDLPLNQNIRNQNVPNLASFLTNAFAAPPTLHDHPSNNPYAEDTPASPTAEQLASDVNQQAHQEAREEARSQQSAQWEINHPGVPNPHESVGRNGAQPSPLNYLVSLINSFGGVLEGPIFGTGRVGAGDYAWGEAGFQNILEDLMNQAAGRAGPQPATDEIIDELPKSKVTAELLSTESEPLSCSICRDDYVISDELITLPCSHAFHLECVTTWLKTSGTCAICRYALVPQTGDISNANAPADVPPVSADTPAVPAAATPNPNPQNPINSPFLNFNNFPNFARPPNQIPPSVPTPNQNRNQSGNSIPHTVYRSSTTTTRNPDGSVTTTTTSRNTSSSTRTTETRNGIRVPGGFPSAAGEGEDGGEVYMEEVD